MTTTNLLNPNGINHLAISTADMKGVLQYFNEVLGMPLAALYWMHGAENTMHGFLKLNASSMLAFVFSPENRKEVQLGNTHPGNPSAPSTMGTMQHLAFNVDSVEDLLALRDRIRGHGIHCMGPADHGYAQSIYFAGPEGISLEVCTFIGSDINKWIDPEVLAELNISNDELLNLQNPKAFQRPSRPVPQPSLSDAKDYKLAFPEEVYQQFMSMSDEQFMEITREVAPESIQKNL